MAEATFSFRKPGLLTFGRVFSSFFDLFLSEQTTNRFRLVNTQGNFSVSDHETGSDVIPLTSCFRWLRLSCSGIGRISLHESKTVIINKFLNFGTVGQIGKSSFPSLGFSFVDCSKYDLFFAPRLCLFKHVIAPGSKSR